MSYSKSHFVLTSRQSCHRAGPRGVHPRWCSSSGSGVSFGSKSPDGLCFVCLGSYLRVVSAPDLDSF